MASTLNDYCTRYFARLCAGYEQALDDTGVRAWLSGHTNASDAGGAFDMSTRMLPALAAWLANPKRPTVLSHRGRSVNLERLAVAVFENAFDPECAGYWGRESFPRRDQRTVESSVLAYSAYLLRDTVLGKVSERGIEQFRGWLDYFAPPELTEGNWNLFWIVNHAARKALGWEYSQETIDKAWRRIHVLDRGDGWMTDGPEGYFDDYNWWVFTTHELWWMQMDGADAQTSRKITDRLKLRLRDYPYFFGADGSYCEFGRSLSYKFARLGAPLLSYKMGLWPHGAGMLARLVRRHLAHYDNTGGVDRTGDTMRQELSTFGHPGVREAYINTGHPYWCMHAFTALWQLDEDDPIWTSPEEALPVEQGDFTRTIRPAGWVLCGSKAGGHVHRYALGSRHGTGEYAAKYAKFLYSTHYPFNAGAVEGDFGPDSALCFSDGDNWAHPGAYDAMAAGDGYLRAKWRVKLGTVELQVETVLVPRGDWCVRAHRIRVPIDAPTIGLLEGGAPVGYAPGTLPAKHLDEDTSAVTMPGRTSAIVEVEGYERPHPPQGFRNHEDLNVMHHRAINPLLEGAIETEGGGGTHELVCLTLTTQEGLEQAMARRPEVEVEWRNNGEVRVRIDGKELVIGKLAV